MIQEITAKTLLSTVRADDRIFGLKYNFNIYRGCPHQCIYCDSRSECYGIADFRDVQVKVNAVELLEHELARKRIKGPIGTGSMSDPYNPIEQRYQLTRGALQVVARHAFPLHLITKSDLVLRDLDLLAEIARVHAAVCFTITTTDDRLGKQIEPGAPLPSARLTAMQALSEHGVPVGVTLMPVLPFITDDEDNIRGVVEQAARHGGTFIIPWFGMSMRDRQREWFYQELDRRFPGLRARYERCYGTRYECPTPNAARLRQVCAQACAEHRLSDHIPYYQPLAVQPRLF